MTQGPVHEPSGTPDQPKLDQIDSGIAIGTSPHSTLEELIYDKLCTSPEQAESAHRIYLAIEDEPIGDLHTHYDVTQIKENVAWKNPTQVFLGKPNSQMKQGEPSYGFDHYMAQLMLGAGVSPEVVYGHVETNAAQTPETREAFDYLRFEEMIETLWRAEGSTVSLWFKISLEEVFEIQHEVSPENTKAIWETCKEKLQDPDFRPQEMLENAQVQFALTTDDPVSDLKKHTAQTKGPALIPTWRPDSVLILQDQGRYNFTGWLSDLKDIVKENGIDIHDLDTLKEALTVRMEYFKENGCVAADIGVPNFHYIECSDSEADALLKKKIRARGPITPEDEQKWQSYMLKWLMTQNAKHGFRQYIHQGPRRDQNPVLFDAYGPDIGGDGPGERLNGDAFVKLLGELTATEVEGSLDGTALAPTVFFTLSSKDYEFVENNIKPFQANSAGIAGKLQLGAPWWFNDTVEDMAKAIRSHIKNGTLWNWVGMLSDARSLPSVIARMKLFRAVLSAELAAAYPDRNTHEVVERYAQPVCYSNGARFLGIESEFDGDALH